ncbi:hypothetical protein HQ393_10060 [Chitinibacter bivalviorum]|uniref:Uncharacterized protein n=1 Tax=Chitinibacter bivalviorum TaxID=2739434 RepID=A0A7H9BJX4_9NEIS|nr:hypothetical protein [Chitinibacter bivalviorum]QLG88558.1 hypothetical protein HQ393_10060 [Chitinibacter bivalviorum]
MAKADFFVFTKKTSFMQRIADLVRSGHRRYVMGTISNEKAPFLVEKFTRLYDVNLPRLKACRRREKGSATARLLWWHDENRPAILTWILLVTDGDLLIDGLEKWQDPTEPKHRIRLTGYELVRITKRTEPKPVWTWRYDKERLQDLRNEVVIAIRQRHDHDLERLIALFWKSPGFAGIRDQVKAVGMLIKTDWKRTRKDGETMPAIPKHLGYVQRLADKGKPFSAFRSCSPIL